MKSWYPNSDPFIGLTTKLTTNKEPFTEFLMSEYHIKHPFTLEYKRNALIQYPETVDANYTRYGQFYKQLIDKYFNESIKISKTRVVIMVSHGIPAHNALLNMFEPEKDLVYLDNSAISLIEKVSLGPK